MARVLIFGGHGRIALLTHPLLVAIGHEVTAVVRNPKHVSDVESTGATSKVADVEQLSTEELTDLVRGHDAIVWSAGAGGGNPERTRAVDHDAAVRSMDAAAAAGVGRYVMVSYFGAKRDHGVDPGNSFYAYAEAKAKADDYLRGSRLDFTVLGPSTLTLDAPTGLIDAQATQGESVSRADVATVIAATLADKATIGRTIRFNSGSVPIADALAG